VTRKRVLVADDNGDNRELARQVLKASFVVLEATDGPMALEVARRERPDLVLLDLSMPRVNGWDVARALKADAVTAGIWLVACTAHAMTGDRERALAMGFDGYLAKPYRVRELTGCVNDFLGPSSPAADAAADAAVDDDEWTLKEEAP
jgi:two-component system cell cycle response regulator